MTTSLFPPLDDIFDLFLPEEDPTVTVQRRVLEENKEKPFLIDMAVKDSGDLPDRGLFKYRIIDEADRSSDEFVGVSTPSDMQSLYRKRKDALLVDDQIYRRAQVILRFEDVSAAQQKASELNDAINDSTKDYNILVHQFLSDENGEIISFPKDNVESLDVKKETYRKLGDDLEAKKSQRNTKKASLENTKDTLESLEDIKEGVSELRTTIRDAIPSTSDATGVIQNLRDLMDQGQQQITAIESTYDTRLRLNFVTSLTVGQLETKTSSGDPAFNEPKDAVFTGSQSYAIDFRISGYQGYAILDDDINNLKNVRDDIKNLRPELSTLEQSLGDVTSIRSVFESDVSTKTESLISTLESRRDTLSSEVETLNNEIANIENQREDLLDEIRRVDPSFGDR